MVQRRIEWSDTDASGFYHNTAAFRLMEAAESVLLSRLGLLEEIYGHLPRVRIEADFRRLLRFHDVVDVQLSVQGVGRSSLTYAFAIARDGKVCVEGTVVAVLVDGEGRPARWTAGHRALLGRAGPQRPESIG
jgi:YbgC/YbaW family acyl-CoA thioester hydrolase